MTTISSLSSPSSWSSLTVCLLCSGNGADTASYRPRRDESQWWNRRDALVRSVAAFLLGPATPEGESRELVLLYDGDHCRMHMKLESGEEVVPTEFVVIGLWKEALTKAPTVVRRGQLSCWAVVSSSSHSTNNHHNKAGSIQDWSKRQFLEYLQKNCSIEFLREHHLNSSSAVLLRKVNRTALAKVYQIWNNKTKSMSSPSKNNSQQEQELQSIFRQILWSNHPKDDPRIAATLHESSDSELPCFGDRLTFATNNQKPIHLVLFLGAVRDMTPAEYRSLQAACHPNHGNTKSIPLVKVRLGSVPEFTSKILSVVAFHQSQQRLAPALKQLAQKNPIEKKRIISETATSSGTTPQPQQQLHIIALVPIHHNQITIDLEQRHRIPWCLVRILVCALWRSKLAGGRHANNNSVPLENVVTLVFVNGTYVTLHQHEWVSSLAEQHQAAPSEYQVLQALIQQLSAKQQQRQQQSSSSSSSSILDWNERAKELVLDWQKDNDETVPQYVVSLESEAPTDLIQTFYHSSKNADDQQKIRKLWAILPLGVARSMQQAFYKAFQHSRSNSSRIMRQSTAGVPCGDWEASSVIMLQHFMYQDRLLSSSSSLEEPTTQYAEVGNAETTTRAGRDPETKLKKDKKKKKKRRKEERQEV